MYNPRLVPSRAILARPSPRLPRYSRAALSCIRVRSTLSKVWVPTGGVSATDGETGHGKLVRAGFLRQSQSGIFQLLPLGVRVQDKIANLLDKHMQTLGASRVSLSTITSEDLWRKSGRFDNVAPELFCLTDRKDASLMLSPTHEEEITTLVASTLNSYKDLPLRLYQITRKYRDEKRPRQGLLRSREFIMKDLYSFDITQDAAIDTYKEVSAAYRAFFADLKLPILVAEASSGDMGGDHSHEYHLSNEIGEDTVAECTSCGYTANDEVAAARLSESPSVTDPSQFRVWRGITKDKKSLVNVWYPKTDSKDEGPNLHAVKEAVAELDTSITDGHSLWAEAASHNNIQLVNVIDHRLADSFDSLKDNLPIIPRDLRLPNITSATVTESNGQLLNLLRLTTGDGCPKCEHGTLQVHRALELGHTFYLGTRYSEPLEAHVTLPQKPSKSVPVQMGCYGIGLSRIFGAVAEHKADDKGLNWPRAIAPFEVVIIPTSKINDETFKFHDMLAGQNDSGLEFDVVLDDRKETFGWKMQDADMTGYPVVVILGKPWREQGLCEVQCRSLGVKESVHVEAVPGFLKELLAKL